MRRQCALKEPICHRAVQHAEGLRDQSNRFNSRESSGSKDFASGCAVLSPVVGSRPGTGCSLSDVIIAFTGLGRVDQGATTGSPTTGSSLKRAMVSSVM